MAIITQNLNFGFNLLALDFSGLYDGASYTETPTRFVVNYANGYKDEFRGTGFTYNANTLEPTGGTVRAYSFVAGSTRLFNIEGLSIPALKLVAVARTASLNDDFALIKTALAGADSYTGGNKADFFSGFAGNDTFNGREGNDLLVGDTGNDTIRGAGGADVLSGDAGADKLIGGPGNDTLLGAGHADSLWGDAGADQLTGGPGVDSVFGGANNDIFILNAGASLANRDVIKDFSNVSGNNDKFQLDNAVMPALGATGQLAAAKFFAGAAAHDGDDRIVYNQATGNVFYDSNGDGAGGAVIIATLTTKPLLTLGDFQVI
jgi:Ca2+-binding RTX toxin-like protein